MPTDIQKFLDSTVTKFNQPEFIQDDPISLPHQFSKKQDIEIIGFWVAMLAWGQRKTIINKGRELIELMDGAPHDFICLLYTSPSPRDATLSRMPSSA